MASVDEPPRRPPKGLDGTRRALWRAIVADFELSDAEYRVLEDALRLTQRADQAAAVVDVEGVTVRDRYGSPKAHPAVDVETRCRATAARLFAQLGVRLVDDPGPVRPGPAPRTARGRR